jgi:hypothetical protein
MKILPLALAAALAAHASFAQAQSTGSGISVLPPSSKETAKEPAKEPTTEPAKENPSAKPGKPAANQGTTGKASGPRTDNPTNALDDNRVSPTTGNPGIQSGRVK